MVAWRAAPDDVGLSVDEALERGTVAAAVTVVVVRDADDATDTADDGLATASSPPDVIGNITRAPDALAAGGLTATWTGVVDVVEQLASVTTDDMCCTSEITV